MHVLLQLVAAASTTPSDPLEPADRNKLIGYTGLSVGMRLPMHADGTESQVQLCKSEHN